MVTSPHLIMAFRTRKLMPARVFINYAHADLDIANKVADQLADNGVLVWIDTENIKGGDLWKKEMDLGLWQSQFVLAIITENSLNPEREWVRYEQERADLLLKVIIPCVFHDSPDFFQQYSLPEIMHPKSAIDFSNWEQGFRNLGKAIESKLTRYGEMFVNHAEGILIPFVGRQEDLKKLNQHINETIRTPTAKKAITISAAGGMGKTMLAKELVRRLAFHYFGGSIVVERGSNQTQARVILSRWAKKLKPPIDREYSQDEISELINDMKDALSQFGELLVLIDDVGKNDLEEVRAIMNALPLDTTIILTTRMSTIPGSFKYSLNPMTEEDGLLLLKSRLRDQFLTEVDPRDTGVFEKAIEAHHASLASLVGIVGGHPLALDLGIGICNDKSIAEIPRVVQRLKDSFEHGVEEFVDQTALFVSDKNESLAISLSLSLEDLKKFDEARGTDLVDKFCMLGVFPDGSTISKALILSLWEKEGSGEAEKMIDILVSRAMLRVNVLTGEYFNHPVIRAYATGLLNKREDCEEVWNRYIGWIIRRNETAFAKPREEWKGFESLIVHSEHIGKRLRKRLESGGVDIYQLGKPEPPDTLPDIKVEPGILALCLKFAHSLKEYIIRSPEWGEQGIRSLLAGLVTARLLDLDNDEITFLYRLGGALTKSKPRTASHYLSQALKLAKKHGQREKISNILSYYGELERTLGNFEFALELLNEALELHRGANDKRMEAATLKYIGEVYWRMSDFPAAFKCYEEALAIYKLHKNESGEADLLNKVGSVYFNKGEHKTAIEYFEKAEEMHQSIGNSSMRAEDINDQGAAYRYLGKSELALDCFNRALEIHEDLSNSRLESLTRSNRAGVLCDMGRYEEALEEGQRAVRVALEVEDAIACIWSYCWVGTAYEGLGQYEEAEISYRESLNACRRTINPRGFSGVLGMYANLLGKIEGRNEEALNLADEALAIMKKHELKQAFGGRTIRQMETLRTTIAEKA